MKLNLYEGIKYLFFICNNFLLIVDYMFSEEMYWYSNFTNLIWIRNHIMAPLSEEFTYRSCMLPLLLQSFSPTTAIFINPLFFGVGKHNLFIYYNTRRFGKFLDYHIDGFDIRKHIPLIECFILLMNT